MRKITYIQLSLAMLVMAVLVTFTSVVFAPHNVEGSTLASAVPHVATSSTIVVGPQSVATLFTKNAACTGRAVSTQGGEIKLSFTTSLTPAAAVGHTQAASTTVMYNNGDYGCGSITAYGFASTTVTLTEFAQ